MKNIRSLIHDGCVLLFPPAMVLILSACTTFTTQVAPQVAKAVKRYCQEPLAERQLIRSQVNGMIAPNTVRVTCEGDPDTNIPAP